MRILITGGTGFVGSHIARQLLAAGHTVRLLVRDKERAIALFQQYPPPDFSTETPGFGYEMVVGDVTQSETLRPALEGCDALVHCAAATPMSGGAADQLMATNVTGVSNVMSLALAQGLEKLVHISSITAIFNTDPQQVHENSPVIKSSMPYGRSKAQAETYLRSLQAQGHSLSIIYPAGIIGPDDPGFSDGFKSLYHRINNGFRVFEGGMQNLDVRDLADFVVALLLEPAQQGRFILPGPYLSWTELADVLEKVSGVELTRMPARGWVLRLVGKLMDMKRLVSSVDSPISAETMRYATQWPRVKTCDKLTALGLHYRSPEITFADSLRWMLENNYLKPEQVPLLKANAPSINLPN